MTLHPHPFTEDTRLVLGRPSMKWIDPRRSSLARGRRARSGCWGPSDRLPCPLARVPPLSSLSERGQGPPADACSRPLVPSRSEPSLGQPRRQRAHGCSSDPCVRARRSPPRATPCDPPAASRCWLAVHPLAPKQSLVFRHKSSIRGARALALSSPPGPGMLTSRRRRPRRCARSQRRPRRARRRATPGPSRPAGARWRPTGARAAARAARP